MANNFVYKISDSAWALLQKLDYVVVYDEKTGKGEVEPPEDLTKSLKPALLSKFQNKIKDLGLGTDAEPEDFFLVLARTEDKANSAISVEHENALMVECIEVGAVEVNGTKGKYNLYLVVEF